MHAPMHDRPELLQQPLRIPARCSSVHRIESNRIESNRMHACGSQGTTIPFALPQRSQPARCSWVRPMRCDAMQCKVRHGNGDALLPMVVVAPAVATHSLFRDSSDALHGTVRYGTVRYNASPVRSIECPRSGRVTPQHNTTQPARFVSFRFVSLCCSLARNAPWHRALPQHGTRKTRCGAVRCVCTPIGTMVPARRRTREIPPAGKPCRLDGEKTGNDATTRRLPCY